MFKIEVYALINIGIDVIGDDVLCNCIIVLYCSDDCCILAETGHHLKGYRLYFVCVLLFFERNWNKRKKGGKNECGKIPSGLQSESRYQTVISRVAAPSEVEGSLQYNVSSSS